MGEGYQPFAQPPTWRTRGSLFVCLLLFDLSGMGDPTRSIAPAGIALEVTGTRKHPHHDKGGSQSRSFVTPTVNISTGVHVSQLITVIVNF